MFPDLQTCGIICGTSALSDQPCRRAVRRAPFASPPPHVSGAGVGDGERATAANRLRIRAQASTTCRHAPAHCTPRQRCTERSKALSIGAAKRRMAGHAAGPREPLLGRLQLLHDLAPASDWDSPWPGMKQYDNDERRRHTDAPASSTTPDSQRTANADEVGADPSKSPPSAHTDTMLEGGALALAPGRHTPPQYACAC